MSLDAEEVAADVAELQERPYRLDRLRAKYLPLLLEWVSEVRTRHGNPPTDNPYCNPLVAWPIPNAYTTSFTLDDAATTPEAIAFQYAYQEDRELTYLPVLWLQDREAWHAAAAEHQAQHERAEAAREERTRATKIARLQAELARLQGATP